jgi:hypothetical protein
MMRLLSPLGPEAERTLHKSCHPKFCKAIAHGRGGRRPMRAPTAVAHRQERARSAVRNHFLHLLSNKPA